MELLFTWLHLSDIHSGHGPESHGWDQLHVLAKLAADIEELLGDPAAPPRPQAILATGDIAYSGDRAPPGSPVARIGEYKYAAEWLGKIAKVADIQRERIFVVPGNHDVERPVDENDKHVKRLVDGIRAGTESIDTALVVEDDDTRLLRVRLQNFLTFAGNFADALRDRDGAAKLFWNTSIPLRSHHKLSFQFRLCVWKDQIVPFSMELL